MDHYSGTSECTVSATREEIEEWNEENDEPHPVFQVDHRPERISLDNESDGELMGQTTLKDFID